MPSIRSLGNVDKQAVTDEVVFMEIVCQACGSVEPYKAAFLKLTTDAVNGTVKHLDDKGSSVLTPINPDYTWTKTVLDYQCKACSAKMQLHVSTTKEGAVCVSNDELDDADKWYDASKEAVIIN